MVRSDVGVTSPVAAALAAFQADQAAAGWCRLPFFLDGGADSVAAELDARVARGERLAPPPDLIFRALRLTPLESVKVVILGQDPYPRPGDANGLAFSYVGQRSLPPSLKVIFAELAADLGCPPPSRGDLTAWARDGVLLLNAILTTTEGVSGAHLKLGWARLADEVVAAVSTRRPAVAFLLWGASARARAGLIDRVKPLVLESGHPSPLNRARDFPGTRPVSLANAWLATRNVAPVAWATGASEDDEGQRLFL